MDRRRPVLVCGTFDLLHRGHTNLLERAGEYGPVVVGLGSDELVVVRKGQRPVLSTSERYQHLLGTGLVSDIVVRDTAGLSSTVALVDPWIIVSGHDYIGSFLTHHELSADWLGERGVCVLFVPRTPGVSSSKLRHAYV